jgi:Ca-activated chloride channel family protein
VELLAAAVLLVAGVAEALHARRVRRVALLAFGPRARPEPWARAAPLLRPVALAALAWGLATLALSEPKVHEGEQLTESEYKHVVLVLDVSPSMRLQDAGPDGQLSRMQRAHEVMESFFRRVAIQQYKLSVVAFYNGAKPVVIDTTDVEVVRNVLSDLPMHYAFPTGKTDVFKGLEEAARIAKPWQPRSTTVILVSDGDTVASTGMPKMPASVANVLVVGVGDPVSGKFIDGRQSRQDASTLRQIAARLRGAYHDGNQNHLPTGLLRRLTETSGESPLEALTRREYALIAIASGAGLYALLPLLLVLAGTRWRPGVPVARRPDLVRRAAPTFSAAGR